MFNRRKFIFASAFLGSSFKYKIGTTQESNISNIKLGNTDLTFPNIGLGSSSTSDPSIIRHAYDRGVRYFDTAESYLGGHAEAAIGKTLSSYRNEIIIGTKTKARSSSSLSEFNSSLDGSLRRLKTDYIDIYFNHSVNSYARLQNDDWWEFIDRAKQQGKIRYSGMSGHGSNLSDCVEYCLDRDLVDVVLTAFSFAQDPSFLETLRHTFHFVAINPKLPEVLKKARKKGVGIIAMKTLAGSRLNDMRRYEDKNLTYAQAAISWALDSGYPDAAILSMTSRSLVDELTSIPSNKLSKIDSYKLLEKYYLLNKENICPPGCDICRNACPNEVDIADIMRSKMYALDYRNVNKALNTYSSIKNNANVCSSCSGEPCLSACGYKLDIKNLNQKTHKLLS